MHRRVLIAALLLALTVVGAAVARDPRAERVSLKPSDVALAKRITLKPADLGAGWTRKADPADGERVHCAGFDPNYSRFTITGKAVAAYSSTSSSEVISAVEVYKSVSDAVGDFNTGAKPAFAKCFARDLDRQFADAGLPMHVTSARVMAAPRVGDRRIAYRVVAKTDASAGNAAVYTDVLLFQRGRTVAAIILMSALKPHAATPRFAAAVAARMR